MLKQNESVESGREAPDSRPISGQSRSWQISDGECHELPATKRPPDTGA